MLSSSRSFLCYQQRDSRFPPLLLFPLVPLSVSTLGRGGKEALEPASGGTPLAAVGAGAPHYRAML